MRFHLALRRHDRCDQPDPHRAGDRSPTKSTILPRKAMSQVSFETPEYTANADALGTLRLLEAIRILGMEERVRFYQASTSELYGKVQETPQRETTPFYPRSPYAAAKLYAYWITVNYREAYGMHASNGILFNHEGPTRGETFVTRKITRAVAAIHLGKQDNVVSRQSRCHARLGPCARLCRGHVDDRAAATARRLCAGDGRKPLRCASSSKRPLLASAGAIEWRGKGLDEIGVEDAAQIACLIEVDPRYFRPTEVELLLGDPTKARQKLGWRSSCQFPDSGRRNGRFRSRQPPRAQSRGD